MMKKPKLIDLRAEKALAMDNIHAYLAVKEQAIEIMSKWPKINPQLIISKLCTQHSMERELWDFICGIEERTFNDEFYSKRK